MVPGSRIVSHAVVLPVIAAGVPQAGAVCIILRPDTLFHGQFNEFLHPAFRPGILGNPGQDICGAHRSGAVCVMGLYPVATGQRGVAIVGCQDFQVFFASLFPAFPCGDNAGHFLPQFLFCHLCISSCLLAAKIQRPGRLVYIIPAGAVLAHDTICQASAVQGVKGYGFLCGFRHSCGSATASLVFQISKVYQGGRVRHAGFQPVFHICVHVLFRQIVLGLLSGVRHQQVTDHLLFLGVHRAGVPVCRRGDLMIKGSPQNGRRPGLCRTDRF